MLFFSLQSSKPFKWPDAAVSAIVALEKASHDAFSSDFQKYNQKLRQLTFNLKVRCWPSTLYLIIVFRKKNTTYCFYV